MTEQIYPKVAMLETQAVFPCSERSKSMKKLDRLTITSNEQSKLIDPPTVLIGNTVRDSPPPQEQTEGIRIDGDSGSFGLQRKFCQEDC